MSHLVLVDVVLVFVVLLPSYAPSPVPVDLFDDPPPRLPHTTSGFARVPPIFANWGGGICFATHTAEELRAALTCVRRRRL